MQVFYCFLWLVVLLTSTYVSRDRTGSQFTSLGMETKSNSLLFQPLQKSNKERGIILYLHSLWKIIYCSHALFSCYYTVRSLSLFISIYFNCCNVRTYFSHFTLCLLHLPSYFVFVLFSLSYFPLQESDFLTLDWKLYILFLFF